MSAKCGFLSEITFFGHWFSSLATLARSLAHCETQNAENADELIAFAEWESNSPTDYQSASALSSVHALTC